jgi:hypothetical protein
MKYKFLLVGCIVALFAIPTHGQTPTDLEKKYGTPIIAYEIRPKVVMTVKYAEDGQPCEMIVERQNTNASSVNLDPYLSDALIKELIDELVPVVERGEKSDAHGGTLMIGQMEVTNFNYENVSIKIVGSMSTVRGLSGNTVLVIKWEKRQCKQK